MVTKPAASDAVPLDDLWRRLTPQVIGAVVRRYGSFDLAEEATQEALIAAATQWPEQGVPDDPRAWLITVASRRLVDRLRSEEARRRREETVGRQTRLDDPITLGAKADPASDPASDPGDDTLTLLLLCCHPALTAAGQVAITLRAVGGLTTAEIAAAFLVPEATMAQRISRAKRTIREAGAAFTMPPPGERVDRMRAVLHVLYLVFTEGHTASTGAHLHRVDLTREAIRLTRGAHAVMPGDGEVAGLLALMLLADARRPARTDTHGRLVPLAEQDRTRWHTASIDEGTELVTTALATAPLGPYQLQAAIAAVHAEASSAAATDWPQILTLYDLLVRLAPGPAVGLNRAVAVAMVHGPHAGLALLDDLERDARLVRHHRLYAVRGHLLEMAGDRPAAGAAYLLAARLTTSLPEQAYLRTRADQL